MYTEPQKTLHSQSKLGEKKKAGDIMPPDFRLYYKAVVIKTAWYRQKNRHTDRRELRNKPIYLQSISLGQGGKNTQWGKDSLFNKWCWGNWTATCKRMKLEHFLPFSRLYFCFVGTFLWCSKLVCLIRSHLFILFLFPFL